MAQSDLMFTFEIPQNAEEESNSSPVQLDVISFELEEALNAPFRLELELSSHDFAIDFDKVIDKPAIFTIWQGGTPVRFVHGLVSDFEQAKTGARRTRYRALILPSLSRLGLVSDWKIFQQKAVAEILSDIFKANRITNFEINSQQPHTAREYCIQPGVLDQDFVHRLAAEEGFVYRIDSTSNAHHLLLTDTIQTLGSIQKNRNGTPATSKNEQGEIIVEPVLYNPNPGGDRQIPALRTFVYTQRVRTAKRTYRDYTFKNPRYSQEHTQHGKAMPAQSTRYERYDYPGRYKQDAVGTPFTTTSIQSLRNNAVTATCIGDDARIEPGLAFELQGHQREDLNVYWRPVHILHKGTSHTAAEEDSAGANTSTSYEQTATLVLATENWKADIPPPHKIEGPLIGHICGPSGEEIFTDEFGRCKVQFPWDRHGQANEHSSCWIRVAQNWAGAGWGHMALPRIGQEVVVSFLDGDCDQPIITGRTFDVAHRTPYKLPALKTQATTKSKEHKGEGYSEWLIDDTTGEVKTKLHTTHAATQLNLGYLTHPRDDEGNGEPRGEGFELRTDASGALRAAKGLFISTDGRGEAVGGQLDIDELKSCIQTLNDMVKGLLDTANGLEAPQASHDEREQLITAVGALGAGANDKPDDSGAEPVVAISAPAGIAAVTPQSVMIGAGRSIELAAQKDAHLTTNQQLHLTSGAAMSLFAATGGITQIANQNDIHLMAQHGNLIGESQESTRLATAGHMTLVAEKRLTLTCGGNYITLTEGGIEIGGKMLNLLIPMNQTGSSSLSEQVNSWGDVNFDRQFQLVKSDGTPAANYKYELIRADGSVISGVSDAQGWTPRQKSLTPEDIKVRLIGPADEGGK